VKGPGYFASTKYELAASPIAKEIGQRLRREEWYQTLSTAPHAGVRRLAATLLVGEILDEVRKVELEALRVARERERAEIAKGNP